MKKILMLLVCMLSFQFLNAQELPKATKKWVDGPDKTWMLQYDDAMAEAKKTKKNVLVLRTGSDWCGWCIKLRKDVFSKPEFKKYAKEHLVLLVLDFPNKVKMPEDQRMHNEMVSRKLQFGGGVPAVVILDPEGNRIGGQSGYSDLKTFMAMLRETEKQ